MTIQQMIQELRKAGYTVSKRAERKAVVLKGKRHEDCVDHRVVDGYSSKVCVLADQDVDEIVAFADEIRTIRESAGDVLTIARMRDAAEAAALRVAA